jgi:hypothetical protein
MSCVSSYTAQQEVSTVNADRALSVKEVALLRSQVSTLTDEVTLAIQHPHLHSLSS